MSVKDYIGRLLEGYKVDEAERERLFKNAEEIFGEYLSVFSIKNKKHQIVLYSEILGIEIRETESVVSTKNQNYLCNINETEMHKIIDHLKFQKCDKSTFINMKELKKINSALGMVLFENVSSVKEAKENNYAIIYIHNRYITLFRDFVGIENDLSYRAVSKNNKVIYKRSFSDEIYL